MLSHQEFTKKGKISKNQSEDVDNNNNDNSNDNKYSNDQICNPEILSTATHICAIIFALPSALIAVRLVSILTPYYDFLRFKGMHKLMSNNNNNNNNNLHQW